ncbi:MAG TPA: RNA polymerase sigma-70 factor [Chitinophagaceae bacterium]
MFDTTQQDKELLMRLLQGDELAFEKIYRLYSPGLYGKLLKLLKSEPQTEEILQDVFLKIWEYRSSIDPDKSFRAFLFKIAENKVYDFFRKAARHKEFEKELIALSTSNYRLLEELMDDEEKSVLLENAIKTLPAQRQEVFRLCKLERKSYKEVGELLDISVSTISDHIVKATKSIRTYFERSGKVLSLIMILWLIS